MGDSFTDKVATVDGAEVTYYEADNGAGYVFLTSSKGYGGAVGSDDRDFCRGAGNRCETDITE